MVRDRSKASFLILAVLPFVLLMPWPLEAEKAADPGLNKVTVNRQAVSMMESVNLTDEDLIDGEIEITGRSNSATAEYSLDAGRTWEKVPVEKNRFEIRFSPGERPRDFAVLLREENSDHNFAVIVRFRSRRYYEVFEKWFAEIRNVYIDERLDLFLTYFDEESYVNFSRFEENMENTFDLNANINLHISIAEVEVEGDVALVRLDWERTWDDSSRASAVNDIVRFRKSNGAWRITDIEDEALFIIGTGTFRGNVSDR